MPTYKGNAGHLMQHWTLSELVDIAARRVEGLNFIDAHAMAPWATECPNPSCTFKRVHAGLPNGQSVYEQAWHQLAEWAQEEGHPNGYPDSANFVQQILNRDRDCDFSLLLCETDRPTVAKLTEWIEQVSNSDRCIRPPELFSRSWRTRFRRGLPGPRQVGLPPDRSVTLMSFDPYKYECNRLYNDLYRKKAGNPGYLYQDDVQRVLDALNGVEGGIIIQLSTYSKSPDNPQDRVVASVNEILVGRGNFNRPVKVVLCDRMMSLVYTRDVPRAHKLADLPRRFDDWRPGQ